MKIRIDITSLKLAAERLGLAQEYIHYWKRSSVAHFDFWGRVLKRAKRRYSTVSRKEFLEDVKRPQAIVVGRIYLKKSNLKEVPPNGITSRSL